MAQTSFETLLPRLGESFGATAEAAEALEPDSKAYALAKRRMPS